MIAAAEAPENNLSVIKFLLSRGVNSKEKIRGLTALKIVRDKLENEQNPKRKKELATLLSILIKAEKKQKK